MKGNLLSSEEGSEGSGQQELESSGDEVEESSVDVTDTRSGKSLIATCQIKSLCFIVTSLKNERIVIEGSVSL